MKELTCIVIGGGYAGINAIKAIWKTFKGQESKRKLRLILIDKITFVKYCFLSPRSDMKKLLSL